MKKYFNSLVRRINQEREIERNGGLLVLEELGVQIRFGRMSIQLKKENFIIWDGRKLEVFFIYEGKRFVLGFLDEIDGIILR